MSVDAPLRPVSEEVPEPDDDRAVPAPTETLAGDAARPPAAPLPTCLVAGLAAAGAGWMAAGAFTGGVARVVALMAAAAGAATVAAGSRSRRPAVFQYLAVAVAVALGFLMALTAGGRGSVPSLVADALRAGGLGRPPVPFDPGWRFVLVVLVCLLSAAGASLALALDRPRVAIGVALPVAFAATLVQPAGREVVSAGVALVFVVAALGVAYGVDLAREGSVGGGFEVRRLVRGAGAMAGLLVVLVLLGRSGVLLPDPRTDEVIPPRRPEPPPPAVDRELFRVRSDRLLTWRLGVLDVYDGAAWLTPPYDPERFEAIGRDGTLTAAGGSTGASGPSGDDGTLTVEFTVRDLPGRTLPAVAGATRITGLPDGSTVDPRTGALRLPEGRPPGPVDYEIEATAPPSGAALSEAGPAGDDLAEFLEVPEPPVEVTDLLADAPPEGFARLQAVREAFYAKVVAAGAGNPVDVPPARVGEMLRGQEATPFEITAAEALLARWAGIPSRIGYGYFGGERSTEGGSGGDGGDGGDGAVIESAIRPKHGATWIEVHFDGFGWVPVVGTPPRAKSSLSEEEKNDDPSVRPTDDLALITFVPVRLQSLRLLATVVRYWLVRLVPLLLLGVAATTFWPVVARSRRRRRRRAWAETQGPSGRLAVAYAELRDTATDLNIGRPSMPPVRFLDEVKPDVQHAELAWLAARGLWGDLARDLREADAVAAEEMSASVARRLRRAQPWSSRVAAAASRSSLRNPYLPDPVDGAGRSAGDVAPATADRRTRARVVRRALPVLAVVALVALVVLSSTSGRTRVDLATTRGAAALPSVPSELAGFTFTREPSAEAAFEKAGPTSLVAEGAVWSVRRGDAVDASLQAGSFKPGLRGRTSDVLEDMRRALGEGRFEPVRLGEARGYSLVLPEQRVLLWFSPDGRSYQLLVARRDVDRPEQLFAALLAAQRGADPAAATASDGAPAPVDPRQGWSS